MNDQTQAFKELFELMTNLSPVCSDYKQARNNFNLWMHRHPEVVEMLNAIEEDEEPQEEFLMEEEEGEDPDDTLAE